MQPNAGSDSVAHVLSDALPHSGAHLRSYAHPDLDAHTLADLDAHAEVTVDPLPRELRTLPRGGPGSDHGGA